MGHEEYLKKLILIIYAARFLGNGMFRVGSRGKISGFSHQAWSIVRAQLEGARDCGLSTLTGSADACESSVPFCVPEKSTPKQMGQNWIIDIDRAI